jgi:hypothetical protein
MLYIICIIYCYLYRFINKQLIITFSLAKSATPLLANNITTPLSYSVVTSLAKTAPK